MTKKHCLFAVLSKRVFFGNAVQNDDQLCGVEENYQNCQMIL